MDEKVITAVAANVVIHPHSVERYRELIRVAFDLKRPMVLRADRNALISRLTLEVGVAPFDVPWVHGVIATFLDIDTKAPWLDMDTLDQAEESVTREVNIPDRLRASLAKFHFLFDPASHVFVAQSETTIEGEKIRPSRLSAGLLAKFLAQIFGQREVQEVFGQVEVTAIPDRHTIETILTSSGLRRLSISIKPPNPDDLEEFADEISERLRRQNAAKMQETLQAPRGGNLVPDEDTKMLARVGAMNGLVEAVVAKDSGGTKSISTAQKPAQFTGQYNSRSESELTGLHRAAYQAVTQIKEERGSVSRLHAAHVPPNEAS